MINPLSNTTPTQPVIQPTGASPYNTNQSHAPSAASGDSVQLSKAAQASLAVVQEASETSTQTIKEAGQGDLQAQRLLSKEAAEKDAAG